MLIQSNEIAQDQTARSQPGRLEGIVCLIDSADAMIACRLKSLRPHTKEQRWKIYAQAALSAIALSQLMPILRAQVTAAAHRSCVLPIGSRLTL
jgi:hypothetical protein